MPMNRNFTCRHGVLAVFLSVFAAASLAAAPDKSAEQRLIAKVFTDGTVFGFAKTCQVSEADLKTLYDKTFATSRAIGIAKVPHYSQAEFRRDFQNGIITADQFSASVAPDSMAAKKNCEDVRIKVKSVVKGK